MVNIDINNYPVLGTMLDRFKEYEPDINMYLRNLPIYNGEQKTEEEKDKDFNEVLKLYRTALVKREFFCDPQLIDGLNNERGSQSVTILIFKLSDVPFITWYNTQVIKNIKKHCATILATISNEYDFLFTGEKEKELNLNASFQKYYEAFKIDINLDNKEDSSIDDEKSSGNYEILKHNKEVGNYDESVSLNKDLMKSKSAIPGTENLKNVDALTFINSSIISLFYIAEEKALGIDGKFPNKIRCAAFCELLYEKRYIIQSKQNQKQMRDFALARYQLNISNALLSVKQEARNKHKNFTVDGMPPLKNYF